MSQSGNFTYKEKDPDPAKSAEVSKDKEITWESVGTLFDILYEHDTALIERTGGAFEQIAKEDTLDFKGDSASYRKSDGTIVRKFEYAEHRYLGDSLVLPEHSSGVEGRNSAAYNKLTLDNGLQLTYGEINGLAGDFFGATNPISTGKDTEARKADFRTAFGFLATSENGRKKAEGLQAALAGEVKRVNEAIKDSGSSMEEINLKVQQVYKKLPFDLKLFDKITKDNSAGPVYTDLLKANLDHFGEWGRLAYNAGHACALEEAAKGGEVNLLRAYAMNGFADHFLEDNFAAGHLRVPRQATTSSSSSPVALMRNLAANVMHEEDGSQGLKVESPRGTKWTCYGDAKLFQPEEDDYIKRNEIDRGQAVNMEQCRDALKQSIKEVHEAYKTGKVISEDKFGAWQIAPDLKKVNALNPNHHPLLFVKNGKLYTRDGGPGSKSGTCMDGEWPSKEFFLWVGFYANNAAFVAEKIRKFLGL